MSKIDMLSDFKKKPTPAPKSTTALFQSSKPIRRKISLRGPVGKLSNVYVPVEHTADPKDVIFNKIGNIPEGVVQFSRILVAVYMPPIVEKTAGGIVMTQQMSDDDRQEFLWQGKVGLIVAVGPQAYEDDEATKFHGTKNKVGDWVWFRASDGIACEVNEVFCRVLTERDIYGVIPHPDFVW